MAALRAKTAPDEAEDEDFGDSKARTTTKYGAVLAATLWDGADFPAFCVVVASRHPVCVAPSFLKSKKSAPVAAIRVM
jgi:hypothetical protein